MQVVYVPNQDGLEQELIASYVNRVDSVVKIGNSKLVLPVVINVSGTDFPVLRKVLSSAFYRYVADLRKAKAPTEVSLDMFSVKIKRMVSVAKANDLDIVVVFESSENIDLVRDELKKWIRQPQQK